MLKATFRPMVNKPIHKGYGYKASPFKARFEATLDLLESELNHLKATDCVIEVDAPDAQFRNDGSIKRTMQPRSPAVRVSFDCKHGHLSYTCATFSGWEANLRAVALILEDLRTMERYGVGKGSEQYTGFAALPQRSGDAAPVESMGFAAVVAELAGVAAAHDSTWPVRAPSIQPGATHAADRSRLVSAAIMVAHPDRGGTDAKIARVVKLRARLEALVGG